MPMKRLHTVALHHPLGRRSATLLAALACLLGAAAPAYAYPQPSLVERSWELAFSSQTPELVGVKNVEGETQWYWYLKYTVTNQSERQRLFLPEFVIATDTGRIVRANENIPAQVFSKIEEREENPLLQSPVQAIGRILRGPDHAVESVAIWRAHREDPDEMQIFVSGLSGEITRMRLPGTKRSVFLRKTLMLTYRLRGNPSRIQDRVPQAHGRAWVMR
jgi:hypothetical protein